MGSALLAGWNTFHLSALNLVEYVTVTRSVAGGQKLRKLNEEHSLLKIPPNEAEICTLHDIFKRTIHYG